MPGPDKKKNSVTDREALERAMDDVVEDRKPKKELSPEARAAIDKLKAQAGQRRMLTFMRDPEPDRKVPELIQTPARSSDYPVAVPGSGSGLRQMTWSQAMTAPFVAGAQVLTKKLGGTVPPGKDITIGVEPWRDDAGGTVKEAIMGSGPGSLEDIKDRAIEKLKDAVKASPQQYGGHGTLPNMPLPPASPEFEDRQVAEANAEYEAQHPPGLAPPPPNRLPPPPAPPLKNYPAADATPHKKTWSSSGEPSGRMRPQTTTPEAMMQRARVEMIRNRLTSGN